MARAPHIGAHSPQHSSQKSAQIGEVIDGRYQLLAHIGSGGMGDVFVAERVALGDRVAIKFLQPAADPDRARARFIREAQIAASLHHPNVVSVFDFGADGERPYLVMELVEGVALDVEIRRNGALPVHRALQLFADLCAAVSAGHRRGIIHRDLKPGNVMLAQIDGVRETVKVLDFGIARLMEPNSSSAANLTHTGTMLGTFQYLAPEQLLGQTGQVASDIFALGVIFYEMLSARAPFMGETPAALLMAITRGQLRSLRELAPQLPDALVRAVHAALSLDPSLRPPSVDALARLAALPRPSSPPPPSDLAAPGSYPKLPSLASLVTNLSVADTAHLSPQTSNVLPRDVPAFTHFVGRASALDGLLEEISATRGHVGENKGRITLIVGEAGIGKSHLLSAFLTQAEVRGCLVRRGRFFDYEGSQPPPHATFLQMLEAAVSQEVVSADVGAGAGDGSDKWRSFQRIAESFGRLSNGRLLILAFDDLQWATAADLELVLHLHRALVSVPVLVVGTARVASLRDSSVGLPAQNPKDFDRWIGNLAQQRLLAVVDLEPFDETELRAFFEVGLGEVRIRPADFRRIDRVTGGNPYYVFELARHLVSTGKLRRDARGWVLDPLDGVELPPTLASMMRAQVTRLTDTTRAVLELAAVLGDELRFDTLIEATDLDEQTLEAEVERLIRRRLLAESANTDNDLRFPSEMLRGVVYDDISVRRRKRLHRQVAEALRVRYANTLRKVARVLCYHHAAVGDLAETLTFGLLAAEDDLKAHDVDRAELSLKRAREANVALEASGQMVDFQKQATLFALSGKLLARLGRYDAAYEEFSKVVAFGTQVSRTNQLDVWVELAQVHLSRGAHDLALIAAERSLDLAAALEAAGEAEWDGVARRRALAGQLAHAHVLSRLGRTSEARTELDTLLETISVVDFPAERSLALRALAFEHLKSGAFREAEAAARQALDLAKRARDPMAEHSAVSCLAATFGESGDNTSSIPFQERALELSRLLSLRRREAIDLANLGEAYFRLGHVAIARSRFDEALSIFIEIGDRACEGDCRVNVGRALLAEGRTQDGLAMLAFGQTICDELGRKEYGAIARLQMGEVMLGEGDAIGARILLEEARDLFAEQGLHSLWEAEFALAKTYKTQPSRGIVHADRAAELLATLVGRLVDGVAATSSLRKLGEIERLRAELESIVANVPPTADP